MKMHINVTTQSGSSYTFTQDDNKFVFLRGIHEGEVVKFREPLKIGGRIDMLYRERSFYDYAPSKDVSTLRSSKIVDMLVQVDP